MYYSSYVYSNDVPGIFRMNLSDYTVEKICENGFPAAVHDGCLFYCRTNENDERPYSYTLYRLGKGEDKLLFDADEFIGDGYNYFIDAVQSQDGHLYVKLSSGPYYSNIAEIDTDGNMLKQIYLNTSA